MLGTLAYRRAKRKAERLLKPLKEKRLAYDNEEHRTAE